MKGSTMKLRTLKNASLLLSLFLLASASLLRADEPKSYGAGVTLTETTSVASILADPDAYVGKKVRVQGKVADVCPMKGCWMEIAEEKDGSSLRIKVDDDVIVFPVSAKGKLAVAEGVVEAISMDRDQYVAWKSHLAEESGKKFDAATVGNGPYRVLQLRGTGARITG
jgi:starvation-inducible outer membrane lipoprotein